MIKNNRRLAIFLHGLYEGGAERTFLNLAKGMAQRGISVDLVLARAAGPFLPQAPEGVRLIDLKSSRVLFSVRALTRYIQQEKPDALLSAIDYTNIAAIWARRLAKKPGRLMVVEQNTLSKRISQLPSIYGRILPRMVRLFYPWADCIVTVSQGVADDLAVSTGLSRQLIQVIHNPVITPDLQVKSQQPLDHPWFRPGQPPVLVAVGRLHPQKKYPDLLQAFAKVRAQRSVRLVILGEGEERGMLEALIDRSGLWDDVNLPGFVDNPYPYMVHASAYVLSSGWEGLPTVLIEALYCGTPVVSTDCPSGPREILKDGLYGRLVRVGDVEGLAQGILDALDGKTPAAPPCSWRPYTLDTILDQYQQALFGAS